MFYLVKMMKGVPIIINSSSENRSLRMEAQEAVGAWLTRDRETQKREYSVVKPDFHGGRDNGVVDTQHRCFEESPPKYFIIED
jgi:hypothetical protein